MITTRYRASTTQNLTQEAWSEFKHDSRCQDGLFPALFHPSCLQGPNSVMSPAWWKLLLSKATLVIRWVQSTGEALSASSQSGVWHALEHREGGQYSQVEFPRSWSRHKNTAVLLRMTARSLPCLTQVLPNNTAILQLWACCLWVVGPKKVPAWKHLSCSLACAEEKKQSLIKFW